MRSVLDPVAALHGLDDGPSLAELQERFGPLTPAEVAAVERLPQGAAYGWPQILATSESDGTAVTGTAAASLLPGNGLFTLPANTLRVGNQLRVMATGRISNIVTTPGNLTLDLRFGSVTAWASGTIPLNIVAKTNVAWWFDLLLTCRSVGSGTTATLLGQGQFTSESVIASPANTAGGSGALNVPVSAPAVGTGFDSTSAQVVDLRATFSLSGNSITSHQYSLWHLTAQ